MQNFMWIKILVGLLMNMRFLKTISISFMKNIHNKQMLDNKVEKMSNFIFEGSWSENLNMIEQTFYEN